MDACSREDAMTRLVRALKALGEPIVRVCIRTPEAQGAASDVLPLIGLDGRILGHAVFRGALVRRDLAALLCSICARTIEAIAGREGESHASLQHMAREIVHDTNNILTVISGHAQLAGRALERDHPAARPVRRVERAVEHARETVASLLDLAQVHPTAREIVDLVLFLTRHADLLDELTPGSHRVEVDIRAGDPLPVRASVSRLRQMLVNLVLNACDAMPSGGIVRIDCARSGDGRSCAHICVHDRGEGIDPEDLGHIFEPGWTTRGSGRGLGLAIVREIVHEHGGDIEIQSTPGDGSCVRIELPLVSMDDAEGVSAGSTGKSSL